MIWPLVCKEENPIVELISGTRVHTLCPRERKSLGKNLRTRGMWVVMSCRERPGVWNNIASFGSLTLVARSSGDKSRGPSREGRGSRRASDREQVERRED